MQNVTPYPRPRPRPAERAPAHGLRHVGQHFHAGDAGGGQEQGVEEGTRREVCIGGVQGGGAAGTILRLSLVCCSVGLRVGIIVVLARYVLVCKRC